MVRSCLHITIFSLLCISNVFSELFFAQQRFYSAIAKYFSFNIIRREVCYILNME
jgi:hypothetical protein